MDTPRSPDAWDTFKLFLRHTWWVPFVVLTILKPIQIGISFPIFWGYEFFGVPTTIDLMWHIVSISAALALLIAIPLTLYIAYLMWKYKQKRSRQTAS